MDKVVVIIIISLIIVIGVVSLIYIFISKNKLMRSHNTKELELTYSINAGIPFKWEIEIENKEIVEYVRSYVIKNENTKGIVGAKIYTNYVFKGLREGTTNIIFKFVNFATNEVFKKEPHLVKVDSNLNISLITDESK